MIYATHREVKDVAPFIDEYDSKTSIYGWAVEDGSQYKADNSGLVTQLFANGEDLGSAQADLDSVDANGEWYYDSDIDTVYYYNDATNPADMNMESGEEFTTLVTRFRTNASKYLNSRLDAKLPREQFKKPDGTYDYIIVRTTALLTAVFLVRSKDPTNELANAMFTEANENIEKLNDGTIKLSWQTSGDSSEGVIRDVSVSGDLNIVETRGNYTGTYDRIKVWISTAGAIGSGKYSVNVKDGDGLKQSTVVDDELITGDYQSLSGGLSIRFEGDLDESAGVEDDEWEIEVKGQEEWVDNSPTKSVRITRRG